MPNTFTASLCEKQELMKRGFHYFGFLSDPIHPKRGGRFLHTKKYTGELRPDETFLRTNHSLQSNSSESGTRQIHGTLQRQISDMRGNNETLKQNSKEEAVELTPHGEGKQLLFIGSVGPCTEIEDSGCRKCTANDLKHNARECAVNGFVKFSTCVFTNGSSSPSGIPQNCTISSQEHSELAFFEVSALSLAVVSTAYVIRRQRQLQEDLQQRVNKMIASA